MGFRYPQGSVPERIQGPIFISSLATTGWGWGPSEFNPYRPFVGIKPDDEVQGEILVYNGSYQIPRIAALGHLVAARQAAAAGHNDVALTEAQQAEALAPELLNTHKALIALYTANHQPVEAQREYATAKHIYDTLYGEYTSFAQPPMDPSAPVRPGS